MAESAFEAVLEGDARRLYDLLSREDQLEIDAIVRTIESDPYPDGRTKLMLEPPPDLVWVYTHPRWWVLYLFPESGHIAVWAIAPSLDPGS